MSYLYYLETKDKLCIRYDGHNTEYLVQLRLLTPCLQEYLAGIDLTFSCRSCYMPYLDGYKLTETEDFESKKTWYGFCYEVIYDAGNKKHPILKMVESSGLKAKKFKTQKSRGQLAYISTIGDFPNESLTPEQIKKATNFVQKKGFKPIVIEQKLPINEIKTLVMSSGCIIGVANDLFYEAVGCEVPTVLIPTGPQAEEVYRLFVESPNVLP